MAAYHCTAKVVSRSKGQSAIAKAAYNARDDLRDERTGERKNYSSRVEEIKFSGIFAPADAPDWTRDRNALWNAAENAELRKDSQLAREVEIALPHELTDQQREWLVKDFVKVAFTRQGMVADVNIHAPSGDGDERNFHAHILLTTREITADGFGDKVREWNSKEALASWRERLADMGANALERQGFTEEAQRFQHGHETLPQQRAAALERGDAAFAASLDRDPSQHKGIIVKEIEARGAVSEVMERREAEKAAGRQEPANDNLSLAELRAEYSQLEKDIASVERIEAAQNMAQVGDSTSPAQDHNASQAGLKVFDAATGAVEKLTEFVADFLTASPAAPQNPDQVAQIIAQRQAYAALENITDSIRNDRPIGVDDIRCLGPADLKGIRDGGDDYLRELVNRMEGERDREREDRGRARDR